MDGDTEWPSPGDLAGGNIADDEASFLLCSCQLSCIASGSTRTSAPQKIPTVVELKTCCRTHTQRWS